MSEATSGRATAVIYRDTSSGFRSSIRVAKGVVIACGALRTPLLLATALPAASARPMTFPLNDAIAVPLLYQALPGLSDDPCNAHTLKNIFAWYALRRGPVLNVVTDTCFRYCCSSVPGAELFVFLVPQGGYSKKRFAQWSLDVAMGVFKEAMTFYVTLGKFSGAPSKPITSFCSSGIDSVADDTARTAMSRCLSEGIRLCREIVQSEPLRNLTTGKEALDLSLFPEDKAPQLLKLLYGPQRKVSETVRDSQAVRTLLGFAQEYACSDDYVAAYIAKHARFFGFPSGTLLGSGLVDGCRVEGMSNAFVGDASVVACTESDSLLSCGGVASAVAMGSKAGYCAAEIN
jgi:hypothetical protein